MQTFVAQKGWIHCHLPNTTQLIYQNTNQFTQTKINLPKLNLISQSKNNFPKYDSYSQKHKPILHSTNTNQMTGCQHHEYQRESEFSTANVLVPWCFLSQAVVCDRRWYYNSISGQSSSDHIHGFQYVSGFSLSRKMWMLFSACLRQ